MIKLWRWVRVAVGILVIIQAIQLHDWIFGCAGFLFSLMAFFNVGCCGSRTCAMPPSKQHGLQTNENDN